TTLDSWSAASGVYKGQIQTTVKPISEIARENGYKCPSRFTERFHNRFKITPRELRKASRE
ncbi:helix-turn-helix domain-containing protein, partial [Escherichia coli]